MIVSNRFCSDGGRTTQKSGARITTGTASRQRHLLFATTMNTHRSSPTSDEREPVKAMQRTDRPTYPARKPRIHQDREQSQNGVTNGKAYRMLAPKLLGSPSELSTPIMRA